MPLKWLIDYWDQAAEYTLPFLRHRPVALQQKFDGQIIYRRHDQGKQWIRVENKKELMDWARQHTFSFHPHLKGDKDFWFVMDIDKQRKDFSQKKLLAITEQMAEIFEKNDLKYLLKYSGGRGFHFMFEITNMKQRRFDQEKKLIQLLRDQLEEELGKKEPLTTTDSHSKKIPVLIDKNIIHKKGMIRSPYSIHPKTELVSGPLKKEELKDFKESDFRPKKIELKKISLPKNRFGLIKKLID